MMPKYGTWSTYTGSSAWILAAILLSVAIGFAFWGTRLDRRVGAEKPGAFVRLTIIVLFLLSGFSFLTAGATYGQELIRQVGPITFPTSPISPVTALSGLITFFVIAVMTRGKGFLPAVGSAVVGTIAAPLIFELPFDLIVMARTYPPDPAVQFTLLYFLPLFAVEISSFAMLTFASAMKVSRYTLFCLASMFLVFSVWALFGFAYPATPAPFALNVTSKILAFATAATLFLPGQYL